MNYRMLCCMLILCVAGTVGHAAVPVVTNVVASQQSSNKLVDIYYDVFDDDGDTLKVRVEVSDNGGNLYSVPAFTFTGDIGEGVTTGANKHIVWDAGTDWDGEYSDEMRVKVIAVDAQGLPGLQWGQEVPPGGFLMGQDGGAEGSGPSRHVNIPWSFWLSKYEVRNDEYCDYLNTALVAGHVYRYGTTEVRAEIGPYAGVQGGVKLIETGDSKDIRWNVNNFEIVAGASNFPVSVTWYGAMAFAQHYGYDLPTDAEWEKATRGPDHDDEDEHLAYPWGDTIGGGNGNYSFSGDPWDNDKSPVGYYDGNQTPFGPDMANGYGLYDVTGNVEEWCRSKWLSSVEDYPQQESLSNTLNAISTSANRVYRGGSYNDSSSSTYLRCYRRATDQSYDYLADRGFRVIRRDSSYVDPVPTVEIEENFDGGEWTVQSSGWTITTADGDWVGNTYADVSREVSLARSGSGCIVQSPYHSADATIELPTPIGLPVGVVLWARRLQSDHTYVGVWLQEWDGTTWRTTDSVDSSTIDSTEYVKVRLNVVLATADSGQKVRLAFDYGACIDDVELYTVPR